MEWIVFSYSLPSKGSSSPRVTLWRRLRRLGAVAPAGGMYILPARDECLEAFQWLAQEIHQAQGEALVLHVMRVDGLTDQQIVALFQAARTEEYAELDGEVTALEHVSDDPAELDHLREGLEKLRRRYAEIARVDYFDCTEGGRVGARLAALERVISPRPPDAATIAPALLGEYRDARWVTRPRPHVDRLACAWLIRQYINPAAAIRYSVQPEPDEIAFDMADAHFGHSGSLCTFETMLHAFGLDEPALRSMADIVHEIDLRDGLYLRPETAGLDVVLGGWLLRDLPDSEREAHGIALFDGLYAALAAGARPAQVVEAAQS
ncbi:MAG TPA: chromate resistance protein ChrB domain-containing protein [Herpetosiphonaceae bacterium]|nr:chromate resistance protein ChrB domain-containing protein [Herpetosiphonaceae bacterium]